MTMTKTVYYQHSDGSVTVRTVSGPDGTAGPELPDGAEQITKEEYDTARAGFAETHDTRLAAERQRETDAAAEDYESLVAAGLPEATARRLTGYRPEGASA